jgi:hypothetical protein
VIRAELEVQLEHLVSLREKHLEQGQQEGGRVKEGEAGDADSGRFAFVMGECGGWYAVRIEGLN